MDQISLPDMEPFVHQALNYGADEIRLIKILPRSDCEQPLRCQLAHEKLSDELKFRALSYEWGPVSHHPIYINNNVFYIRENLLHFLQTISLNEELCQKMLWVDQICIHQKNEQERNHQVNLMANIYAHADRVYVWLGCEWLPFKEIITTDPRFWKTPLEYLLYLSNASYWRRVWIIQEILLAKSIDIIFTTGAMTFRQIETIQRWVCPVDRGEYKNAASELLFETSQFGRLLIRRFKSSQGFAYKVRIDYRQDWASILWLCKDSLCTDPRDRIFGVLGAIEPACRIPVDYSISLLDICIEVMKTYVQYCQKPLVMPRNSDPDSLQASRHAYRPSDIEGMPAERLAQLKHRALKEFARELVKFTGYATEYEYGLMAMAGGGQFTFESGDEGLPATEQGLDSDHDNIFGFSTEQISRRWLSKRSSRALRRSEHRISKHITSGSRCFK